MFQISRVQMSYHSSEYPYRPGRSGYSSLDIWGVRDLPAYYTYRVGMRLTSPDQPEVQSLDCFRKWAVRDLSQYPTLAEIRSALGDQATLALP